MPRPAFLLILALALLLSGCGGGPAAPGAAPGATSGAGERALAPPAPPELPSARLHAGASAELASSLPLAAGWNLVSFPVAEVTAVSPGPGVHAVLFAYDPGAGTYLAVDFTPEALNEAGGPGRGFWALATQPTEIGYEGTGTPATAPLAAGWNLVGLPAGRAASLDLSLGGGPRQALSPSACPQIPPAPGCLVHASAFAFEEGGYLAADLSTPETAFPGGLGYWLYAHQPATLHLVPSSLLKLEVDLLATSLPKGTTWQLRATGLFADGSVRDVTAEADWASTDPSVAAVQGGTVTGLALGRVEIHASLDGRRGTAVAFVTDARPAHLEVSPNPMVLAKGTSGVLRASLVYTDGTVQDVTASASYRSGNSVIVGTGSPTGTLLAKVPGTTTVTATASGVSGTADVTVTSATPVELEISYNSYGTATGYSAPAVAKARFTDGSTVDVTAESEWSSSNPSCAAVQGTRIMGVAPGTVDLTARWQGLTQTQPFVVRDTVLQSLQVSAPQMGMPAGHDLQLTATGSFSNGFLLDITDQVTWASSDESVGIVSNASGTQGQATGVRIGFFSVTATRGAVTGSRDLQVLAPTVVSLRIEPGSPVMPTNSLLQLRAIATMSDGSTADYTSKLSWSSSSDPLARVDNAADRGLVTSYQAGTVTITARSWNTPPVAPSASVSLQVVGPELVGLRLSPPHLAVVPRSFQQMTALAVFADGTTRDFTSFVTWSVEGGVGSPLTTPGSIYLHTSGTGLVRARLGDLDATADATVTEADLGSLALGPDSPRTGVGGGVQLTCLGIFTNSTGQPMANAVSWSSSDPAVAEVRNDTDRAGYVTGVSPGTAVIQATHLPTGVSSSLTVTVTSATLTSLSLRPTDRLLLLGRVHTLVAQGTWSDGTTADLTPHVTWSADGLTVRNTPGAEGQVTPQQMGSATVQAFHPGSGLGASGTLRVAAFDQFDGSVPMGRAAVMCSDPQGRYLYVLDSTNWEVLAVELATRRVLGRVPVGPARDMDLSADGRTLVVAASGETSLLRIGVPELSVTTFPTGSTLRPYRVQLDAGQRAFVLLSNGDRTWELAEFDFRAGTRLATHLSGSSDTVTNALFRLGRSTGKLFFVNNRYDVSAGGLTLDGTLTVASPTDLSPDEELVLTGSGTWNYLMDARDLVTRVAHVTWTGPFFQGVRSFSAQSDLVFAPSDSTLVQVGHARQSGPAMLSFDVRVSQLGRKTDRLHAVAGGATLVISAVDSSGQGELHFVAVRR